MDAVFSKLIGTLAVILVVAAFIGGSDILSRLTAKNKQWLSSIIVGVLGGIFGIYGNISGFNLNGAVISVRDIGPMLSGFIGGPVGGLIAGLIAGLHRLTMGGLTARACVVATCCIGLLCGFVSLKRHEQIKKAYAAFLLSALMEAFHLCVVLVMVKPFESAFGIVRQIALPFIVINAVGFVLMVTIIVYTDRQRTLTLEKSRMQSELEVANVIQHSLLPVISADYPGRSEVDVAASMEAAKEVGGDFYDAFFVDSNRIVFAIGDVSGKGVPAALFMATAKITLQNCIRDIPNLSEAIEVANNALCARNEAEMFVTLWVGVLDLGSGELTYVSAGHNPPIVVQDGAPAYLKTKNGFVLAGMEDMIYKAHTITLHRGDVVYLYTDGVTEANAADETLFGEERLLHCFESDETMTAAQILEAVRQSVDAFVQQNDQFDDITMLCFRYLGAARERTFDATLENVGEAIDFVGEAIEELPLSGKARNQISVSVDEIVSNVARYAYDGAAGTVTVQVDSDKDGVAITVTDSGRPYDPLQKEDPDVTLSLEERGVGGYGIFLVKKMMDDVRYAYRGGRNILTMRKNFSA